MTVSEMIEVLKKMPQDLKVVSDYPETGTYDIDEESIYAYPEDDPQYVQVG